MTSIPTPEPYWEDELPSFLEMVKDRYDFKGFINEKNTAWITYRN